MIDLSLSAIFLLFAVPGIWLNRRHGLPKAHVVWFALGGMLWLAVFVSQVVNLTGRGNAAIGEFRQSVRYAYWIFVFLTSVRFLTWSVSGRTLVLVLASAMTLTAAIRWGEVFLFHNPGSGRTFFVSRNSYAALFSGYAPTLYAVALEARGRRRLFALGGVAVVLSAAVMNSSRGGWVAVLVGVVVFMGLLALSGRQFPRVLLLGAVLVTFGVLGAILTPRWVLEPARGRYATLDNVQADKTFAFRLLLNQKALRLFRQNPAFGIGPGAFERTTVTLDLPDQFRHGSLETLHRSGPHNSYLRWLSETGLVGAIPLALLLLLLAVRGGLAAVRLTRMGHLWAAGLYAGFVAFSVHLWVLASLGHTATWLMYGLVAGMTTVCRRVQRAEVLGGVARGRLR